MATKGYTWFVNEFLPSLEQRMTNPKYPNSCILSEKQADVCCRYMKSEQHSGVDYNWVFTTYNLTVGNKTYTLSTKGSYTFLSVRDLDWENNYFEAKRRADMVNTLVKKAGLNREELENKTIEEIDDIFDREFEDCI